MQSILNAISKKNARRQKTEQNMASDEILNTNKNFKYLEHKNVWTPLYLFITDTHQHINLKFTLS